MKGRGNWDFVGDMHEMVDFGGEKLVLGMP